MDIMDICTHTYTHTMFILNCEHARTHAHTHIQCAAWNTNAKGKRQVSDDGKEVAAPCEHNTHTHTIYVVLCAAHKLHDVGHMHMHMRPSYLSILNIFIYP
jgi:hypothetical protein